MFDLKRIKTRETLSPQMFHLLLDRKFYAISIYTYFSRFGIRFGEAIQPLTPARCHLNYYTRGLFPRRPFLSFVSTRNDWYNWSIRAPLLFPGRRYAAVPLNRVAECNSARCSHRFASAPPENCKRPTNARQSRFRRQATLDESRDFDHDHVFPEGRGGKISRSRKTKRNAPLQFLYSLRWWSDKKFHTALGYMDV